MRDRTVSRPVPKQLTFGPIISTSRSLLKKPSSTGRSGATAQQHHRTHLHEHMHEHPSKTAATSACSEAPPPRSRPHETRDHEKQVRTVPCHPKVWAGRCFLCYSLRRSAGFKATVLPWCSRTEYRPRSLSQPAAVPILSLSSGFTRSPCTSTYSQTSPSALGPVMTKTAPSLAQIVSLAVAPVQCVKLSQVGWLQEQQAPILQPHKVPPALAYG
jgi:hypothetical protein